MLQRYEMGPGGSPLAHMGIHNDFCFLLLLTLSLHLAHTLYSLPSSPLLSTELQRPFKAKRGKTSLPPRFSLAPSADSRIPTMQFRRAIDEVKKFVFTLRNTT